jgi:hypothetical protein
MKRVLVLAWLTITAWGLEPDETLRLLTEAAETQGEAYLVVRNRLVEMGDEVVPLLRHAGEDGRLTWRERLVARIIQERIQRDDEIKALQMHGWRDYPPYRRVRENPALSPKGRHGIAGEMGEHVIPKMKEAGLPYYFIEQNWKTMWIRREAGRIGLIDLWPRWCRAALSGQPEEIYLWWAIADRIEKNEMFMESYDNRVLYRVMAKQELAQTVPVLLTTRDSYITHEFFKPDQRVYRDFLLRVISFAEPQHMELLEQFIAEREEMLGDLRPRLDEVRKREPQPVVEPPFRSEKRPPLEGAQPPPPGFFDPPSPPEPAAAEPPSGMVIEI